MQSMRVLWIHGKRGLWGFKYAKDEVPWILGKVGFRV
jgi:hypothetical protein